MHNTGQNRIVSGLRLPLDEANFVLTVETGPATVEYKLLKLISGDCIGRVQRAAL